MKNFSIHIPRWEELPNIDLYLDQVVTVIEEDLGNFITNKDDKIITKTMINNYVKHRIITPPENKKYSKSHLAKLIVICMLKQVYSINDIGKLIELALNTSDIQISYNTFCIELEKAVDGVFNKVKITEAQEMTEQRYILKNVVNSFASKIYVEKIFLNNKNY